MALMKNIILQMLKRMPKLHKNMSNRAYLFAVTSTGYLRWKWTAKKRSVVTAVKVKKEIEESIQALDWNIIPTTQKTGLSSIYSATTDIQKKDCEKTLAQRSDTASPRISMFEGVRRDGVFKMV